MKTLQNIIFFKLTYHTTFGFYGVYKNIIYVKYLIKIN